MIAGVGGDDHAIGCDAFGESRCDGQHDAVAEGHDGLFHRLLGVVAIRNPAAGSQKIGFEQAVHEIERDGVMGDAVSIRMEFSKRNLAGVVFRAVIEGQAGNDVMGCKRLVKHGHRIHTAAEKHTDFHAGCSG